MFSIPLSLVVMWHRLNIIWASRWTTTSTSNPRRRSLRLRGGRLAGSFQT